MAVIAQTMRSAQAIAAYDLVEGRLVKLSTSGQRNDLRSAVYASVNDVEGIYVVFFPPDNFPRPTPVSLYTAPYKRTHNWTDPNNYTDPVITENEYRIPPSLWRTPTVPSGALAALHTGKLGLPDGVFHESAGIKVPGSWVRVGASGMLQTTSTASESIGHVDVYDSVTGMLYIQMKV